MPTADRDISVFKALFENAFDAFWIVDERMVIEEANAAASVLTGYTHAELVGRPLSLLLPPEIAAHHDAYVDAYQQGRSKAGVLGKARRFEVKTRNGELVPIHLKAFELEAIDGRKRYGAIMVDLRDQTRLEDEQKRTIQQLERLALVDPLTSLWNRRAFDDALERQQALLRRQEGCAAVALIDLDHFKSINDTYGHAAGDCVLQFFATQLNTWVRREDVCARVGGEEFGVLLPGATAEGAYLVMERALERIATTKFELEGGASLAISFSAGVATFDGATPGDEALARADRAMYAAKANGRACVECWSAEIDILQREPA